MLSWNWKAKIVLYCALNALGVAMVGQRPESFNYWYQTSGSVPNGLYRSVEGKEYRRDQLVVFKLKKQIEQKLNVPPGMRGGTLMKKIGAMPGQTYCVLGGKFYVNRQLIGNVKDRARNGTKLMQQDGCHVIRQNHFLPYSDYTPDSIDGRYFGQVSIEQIITRVEPIITW